jgi:hypothetical protein
MLMEVLLHVMPAEAGIQCFRFRIRWKLWIPAFAGMTKLLRDGGIQRAR